MKRHDARDGAPISEAAEPLFARSQRGIRVSVHHVTSHKLVRSDPGGFVDRTATAPRQIIPVQFEWQPSTSSSLPRAKCTWELLPRCNARASPENVSTKIITTGVLQNPTRRVCVVGCSWRQVRRHEIEARNAIKSHTVQLAHKLVQHTSEFARNFFEVFV